MRLTTLAIAALLAALRLVAEPAPTNAVELAEVKAAGQTTTDVVGRAETNAVEQAQPPAVGGTDVIDLSKIDDSALAEQSQPKVTPADGQGDLIDITCDEATLSDILHQLRKTTNANLIYSESKNLQRRVSTKLTRVPWREALQAILSRHGFRLETRGTIDYVTEDKVEEPTLTRSFTLNHASAKEMADLFNANYAQKDDNGRQIEKIATEFEGANAVIVTASEKVLTDCEAIIRAVDKAVAQIYIEARFLELSSAAMHKLGVDWSSLESWKVTATGMKAGWQSAGGTAANYGSGMTQSSQNSSVNSSHSRSLNSSGATTSESFNDNQSASANNTMRGLFPETIQEAKGAGLSAADMAWENARGFSGQLSAQDFSLALSAFESLGEGKIFSNPKVIVSNGKEAKVDMTTKFPNVDVTSQRNTTTTSPYLDVSTRIQVIPGDRNICMFAGDIFYSWGITLTVRPRISPDGLISVEIVPTISELKEWYEVGNSASADSKVNTNPYSKFPVIDMKRITTEFTMKDGSTAVIGGLSKTEEEDVDTGIPYLRKIPWLGQHLFGWKGRQKVQKEIIVCVTIGIANPAELPKDMGLPKNAVLGREYVEGRRKEPGDREGGADKALALDTSTLDAQRERRDEAARKATEKSRENERGNVTITSSAKTEAAPSQKTSAETTR